MKNLFLISAILATGCASTTTRQISSADPSGQEFTCSPMYAGGGNQSLHVWVSGDRAAVQNGSKFAHYKIEVDSSGDPGKPSTAGGTHYFNYARLSKETPANYDPDGLQVDVRMRDGTWKKNANGRSVSPDLHFAVVDGHSAQSDDLGDDTHPWNCEPND